MLYLSHKPRLRPKKGMLLFLGLVDVVQSINGHNLSLEASNLANDVLQNLASKVLHTFLVIAMEWSSSYIQLAKFSCIALKILEGKAPPFSLTVIQAIVALPTVEDQTKLAMEAILCFDAHALDSQEPTSFYDLSSSAGAYCLSNVDAQPARELRGALTWSCKYDE